MKARPETKECNVVNGLLRTVPAASFEHVSRLNPILQRRTGQGIGMEGRKDKSKGRRGEAEERMREGEGERRMGRAESLRNEWKKKKKKKKKKKTIAGDYWL